jgi:DNA-binding MarR family transcriptional regulator
MVENGYLQQERSPHDRRAVNVRVSPKGLEVCERLNAMYERHANELSKGVANPDELQNMNALLRRLERFWSQSMDYSVRPTGAIENAA